MKNTPLSRHLSATLLATALTLTACGSDSGKDSTGPVSGQPATGTGTGATGTGTGNTTTGTGTGATGTGTGATSTGTGTGTGNPGVRSLITGCDPTFCTFTVGGGPSGGDLCSCLIDGPDHPTASFVEASCWGGAFAPIGTDLTFAFDLNTLGYEGYSVDTCLGYDGDSSVAVYDADPVTGGNEEICQEDSIQAFCNRIGDPGDAFTPAYPTARPASGEAWIVIDEWDDTELWNGATPRQIDFELFIVMPVCGNSATEPGEECDDGNLATGDGCDDFCQREPNCGDGFVDFPELCDDGNLVDGDGCDATCQPEPLQIEDCDPSWCVFTAAGGPNGGDLCECTIPAAQHPLLDSLPSVCGGGGGADVVFGFDKASYASVAADTCMGLGGDSVLVLFGDDPRAGAPVATCNDDAAYEGVCSKIWDPQAAGTPATLVNTPAGGSRVYFQVDEFNGGDFWDGVTDRVIRFELSTAPGTVCGDGVVEQLEQCDDGNLTPDDGCSDTCTVEPLQIRDCDPAFCTLAVAGGPNGGDLCTCTIPGANHPVLADFQPNCGFGFGPEAILSFDKASWQSIAATNCGGAVGTTTYYGYYYEASELSLYGDDPYAGGFEDTCSNTAIGEGTGCSKLWDPQGAGVPPELVNIPAGGARVYLVVDDAFGFWWDGVTDRVIEVELSSTLATICGDGTAERNEACDDGNLIDGDGCSATCNLEPMTITGCDPTWCTMGAGAGPNGGDLCECTIPGVDHPTGDVVPDANCFAGGSGKEILFRFDTTGYTRYAVDTCASAPGLPTLSDSAIATYDADPLSGGLELACNDDANGQYDWCSKITDTAAGVPAGPAPAPASNDLWLQIDEYDPTGQYSYWDGTSDRTFSIELIP